MANGQFNAQQFNARVYNAGPDVSVSLTAASLTAATTTITVTAGAAVAVPVGFGGIVAGWPARVRLHPARLTASSTRIEIGITYDLVLDDEEVVVALAALV